MALFRKMFSCIYVRKIETYKQKSLAASNFHGFLHHDCEGTEQLRIKNLKGLGIHERRGTQTGTY